MEACLLDVDLARRYPDEATRRRVCGAVKAKVGGDEATAKADEAPMQGRVTEAPTWYLIHDAVAAREGVNDRGEYKPWTAIQAAAPSLDGVPLVYGSPGHPRDANGAAIVDVDPAHAVGFAVNVRLDEEEHRLLYDALLLRGPGYEVNDTLAGHVKAGGVADNSVGYYAPGERFEVGVHGDEAYRVIQPRLRFGHIAILAPFSNRPGACPAPECGIGVDEGEVHACQGGDSCCKTRMEASVQAIRDGLGASRLTALRLVAALNKGS